MADYRKVVRISNTDQMGYFHTWMQVRENADSDTVRAIVERPNGTIECWYPDQMRFVEPPDANDER